MLLFILSQAAIDIKPHVQGTTAIVSNAREDQD